MSVICGILVGSALNIYKKFWIQCHSFIKNAYNIQFSCQSWIFLFYFTVIDLFSILHAYMKKVFTTLLIQVKNNL